MQLLFYILRILGLNWLEIERLFWNFWDILVCLLISVLGLHWYFCQGRLLFWLLATLAQSRITTQSCCNWSTDVPGRCPSSIYSGTTVEWLHWDCTRIENCSRIVRIVGNAMAFKHDLDRFLQCCDRMKEFTDTACLELLLKLGLYECMIVWDHCNPISILGVIMLPVVSRQSWHDDAFWMSKDYTRFTLIVVG